MLIVVTDVGSLYFSNMARTALNSRHDWSYGGK